MSGDKVVSLHCSRCRQIGAIACVRLTDCQILLKCIECGDVTASNAFMSRELLETLHAGNTPEQIAARKARPGRKRGRCATRVPTGVDSYYYCFRNNGHEGNCSMRKDRETTH